MASLGLLALLLSLTAVSSATAQQAYPQTTAALQQLSRSPAYAPTIQLIRGNQVLYNKFITSPFIATALENPTGAQFVLRTFGSPIYKEILSNPQTSALLAASPTLTVIFATPADQAPTKLQLLYNTSQLSATGNAVLDYQTLQTGLASVAASGLAPTPGPSGAPSPAVRLGTLPAAG